MSATAGQFIQAMESYLGVAESPPGSNMTRVGVEFGWNGVAWCAETVSCAATKVGFALHTASVYVIRQKAQNGEGGMSWITDFSQARPGDIFCFKGDEHTGVVAYLQGGGFVSIEGNWGDKCQRVTRPDWSAMEGLARLPFANPLPPAKPAPVPPSVPPTQVKQPGVLQQGDQGLEVALVQLRLNNLRGVLIYAGQQAWGPCDQDGQYGPITKMNVAGFQGKYGLNPDGVWGPITSGKMSAVEALVGIHY